MANRQNNIMTDYEEKNDREIISEGTVTLRNQTFEFRQTYVDISPLENVTITAGKQTIVWGQLDVFSPIDFLLPLILIPWDFLWSKLITECLKQPLAYPTTQCPM